MSDVTVEEYEHCSEVKTHRTISVEERGKKLVIRNPQMRRIRQVRVDHCLPIVGAKCDWLFEIPVLRAVYYVELKGRDIKHALEQVLATVNHHFFVQRHAEYQKHCIIVSSQVPSMTPSIQKLKKQCREMARGHLKIKTRQYQFDV